ncbi:MAG TPA: 6-phosphogluconolactonase, partial [Geobacteraceae bacterium]|nr:6-phosphogluconolactonase [Geobacteraceae bacterium]
MIKVYPDQESLSQAAAKLFVDGARRAAAAKGRFAVLLAGGETPRRTYEILARPPLVGTVPWGQVHLFWGDERYVPSGDPASNARMVGQALISHVPVPASQVHPIPYRSSPRESAVEYEDVLRSFFMNGLPRFDLVFLGLGENGHTASLFPGTSAVEERHRWVTEVYVAEQGTFRVTLTAPVINRAALVVFIVSGKGKSAILRETLEGNQAPRRIPARLIKPSSGELLWLVDREAARLLRNDTL